MNYLSTAQALFIASEVTGISPLTLARISRLELLESALALPAATFDGRDLYPDLFDKAAVLGSRIVRNHPLQDGNKRLAWTCVVVFLDINGWILSSEEDDAVKTILELAAGELSEVDFAAWIARCSQPA